MFFLGSLGLRGFRVYGFMVLWMFGEFRFRDLQGLGFMEFRGFRVCVFFWVVWGV